MNAEQAYLFRHALLRDGAYQMQLPVDRAALHRLALGVMEGVHGGRPPAWDAAKPLRDPCAPHALDRFAEELGEHARRAAGDLRPVEALYLHRAAKYAEGQHRLNDARKCWLRMAELVDDPRCYQALREAAVQAYLLSRAEEAEDLLRQVLDRSRRAGDREVEGIALSSLAALAEEDGRHEESERIYEQALAMHREAGNRRWEGITLGNRAHLMSNRGHAAAEEHALLEALAIHREIGDGELEGFVLANLAGVYRESGRYAESESTFQQALVLLRNAGNLQMEGIYLGNLANTFRATGRWQEAEQATEQALGLSRRAGDLANEAALLRKLGLIYRATGRYEEAAAFFARALEGCREVGATRMVGSILCERAVCATIAKGADGADADWQQGLAILSALGASGEIKHQIQVMLEACAKADVVPLQRPAE